MWLGLYLIAFSLWGLGGIFGNLFSTKEERQNWKFTFKERPLACISFCAFGVGLFSLPIITIAYGISLIINN